MYLYKPTYVYAYLREDLTPYYIGKGQGRRAWESHASHKMYKPVDPSRIVIIYDNLNELWALKLERDLIKWFGRKDNNTGILRNRTDGGEGRTGMTLEERAKLSKVHKGKTISAEHRAKTSKVHKGKTVSAETRAKMSKAQKGLRPSKESISLMKANMPNTLQILYKGEGPYGAYEWSKRTGISRMTIANRAKNPNFSDWVLISF